MIKRAEYYALIGNPLAQPLDIPVTTTSKSVALLFKFRFLQASESISNNEAANCLAPIVIPSVFGMVGVEAGMAN